VSAQPAGRLGDRLGDRLAVLAAERITWMVIRGGRLGSRPWTAGENE